MGRIINLLNFPEPSGPRETVDRRPGLGARAMEPLQRGLAMPMFELSSGRARLVQPMQPNSEAFGAEVRAVLADHLGAVVGEDLFVVRGLGVSGTSDVLALDASGRPIVIAVTYLLDHDAMVTSLERAGLAARMTEPDLARAYHPGDPTRFSRDFADFRTRLPFSAQSPQHMGPRLVIVCSDIAPEVSDAAGLWRSRGGRLDILQVGVIRGEDDRRMIVLAPYADHESRRRIVEPTALRLVHGGVYDAIETTRSVPAVAPVSSPKPTARPDASASSPEPPVVPQLDEVSKSTPEPFGAPIDVVPQQAAPVHDTVVVPKLLMDTIPPVAPTAVAEEKESVWAPSSTVANPLEFRVPDFLSNAELTVMSDRDEPEEPVAELPTIQPPPGMTRASHASRKESAAYPELLDLASELGAPTELVWRRLRRGERFIAVLRSDGFLELPSGRAFDDPSEAAASVARSDGQLDGWRAWRIGDDGPTLADAIDLLHR